MSTISLSLWFQWAVRQLTDADLLMTSAKRIGEYVHNYLVKKMKVVSNNF
jgi:hypothetical protein